MNAPAEKSLLASADLRSLAFALLAPGMGEASGEARWLDAQLQAVLTQHANLAEAWQQWWQAPPPSDLRLHALATQLGLESAETLALALCCAVEFDPMVGRALAWLQSPSGGARPTAGLAMTLAARLDPTSAASAFAALGFGRARRVGLFTVDTESRALPEATLRTPLPLVLAISGQAAEWPGVQVGLQQGLALPPSIAQWAERYAAALRLQARQALVLRSGHPMESRAAAAAIAAALGAEAAFLSGEPPAGLGPWLWLSGRVPVLVQELAPGESFKLPLLEGYDGPLLVASGPDGSFSREGEPIASWRVPAPAPEERVALWQQTMADDQLASWLGHSFCHYSARIQGLGQAARFQAALAGRAAPLAEDLAQAGRNGVAADLGTLAELQTNAIDDSALVLPPALKVDLEILMRRCLGRDSLSNALGPSTRARHKSGVRALLYGPSGTGKTLAVGWLATRLGLPLYRVDLASVTSKYIGETEKNLAQLFARAEHAEVVLLFDEADSLFGKRTEVKDSNDRFANGQTNYLLQRIESFEGIAILTSNSRARFDSAFARRLDAVIEFPMPSPEERRALWRSHLGEGHSLSDTELNRLAAACDLAGGHIRNVVLAAAASVRGSGCNIAYGDLMPGLAAEYRKLGRQLPPGL